MAAPTLSEPTIQSLVFSGLTAIAAYVAIKVNVKKLRDEEAAKCIEHALVKDHTVKIQASLDHAHDKIRDLYSKSSDTSVVIAQLQVTMDENTRVLRLVEEALKALARVEERVNAHIEMEK